MSQRVVLKSEGITCRGTLRQTDGNLIVEMDNDAPDNCRNVFERSGFRVKPEERRERYEDEDY